MSGSRRLASPEDLHSYRLLGDLDLTPDGKRLACAVRDYAAGTGLQPTTRLWVGSSCGRGALRELGAAVDRHPKWHPGGDRLAFASNRDDPTRLQLCLADAELRDITKLGDLPGSVDQFQWNAVGDAVNVLVASPAPQTPRGASERPADPRVARPAPRARELYSVAIDTGAAVRLGPAGLSVWEFSTWGDLGAVAVVSSAAGENQWYSARIVGLQRGAADAHTLYKPRTQVSQPQVSPDGHHLAFIEGASSDRGMVAGDVTVVDLDTNAVHRLPVPHCDVSYLRWVGPEIAWAGWSDVGTACGWLTTDGRVTVAWAGQATLGYFHQLEIAAAEGHMIAAAVQSPSQPLEVAMLCLDEVPSGWRPITDLNSAYRDLELPAQERIAWTSDDGTEVSGIVVRPPIAGQQAPALIVMVHGGPSGAWTFEFLAGYFGHATLLASAGYAVLLPNPRGSVGRGSDFAQANHGDAGGCDFRDIVAGVGACTRAGIADGARAGICGLSYGGYMAAWAATQPSPFGAAVSISCVADWIDLFYSAEGGEVAKMLLGTEPAESADRYVARSPIAQASATTIPLLLIQGQEDTLTPLRQAEALYAALAQRGAVVELVVYEREGHVFREAEHLAGCWRRMSMWFGSHVR